MNIEAKINKIQKVGAKIVDLTKDEIRVLDGILRTEIMELKGLVKNADNDKDKKELEKELSTVEAIFSKLNN